MAGWLSRNYPRANVPHLEMERSAGEQSLNAVASHPGSLIPIAPRLVAAINRQDRLVF